MIILRYMIISAPKSTELHVDFSGLHVQKITSATASQPVPASDASIQTQPAVVIV